MMNKRKSIDDIADTISMRSDMDDDDASGHHDRKASKLRNLIQTMDTFSQRAKTDKPKV